jgi:predicted RNA polymerase sigma factor
MTEPSKRLKMLEAMIAKGSEDPFIYYARALELRGAGQPEQALQALSEVRERFANYVPSYLAAGQLAIELGQTEQARDWLTAGIDIAKAEGDEHARSELQEALDTL